MTYKYYISTHHCMLKTINQPAEDIYTFPKYLNSPPSYILDKLNTSQLFPNLPIYDNAILQIQIFISCLKFPYHNPDENT